MNFLQPWLLLGLPLLLLPIIIHLINQWRYQTKAWGAMMFLLAATKMAKGIARLRQYLILAMRVLAIAGLIFSISRPLASGVLGLAGGGRVDMTLVLIDRSPSMQQQNELGNQTKLDAARRQLLETLRPLGSSRWVLIDSASLEPMEFPTVEDLFDAPQTRPLSATCQVPALLQSALNYLQNQRPGQAEIWICSDLRQSDWNAASSEWSVLRDGFRKFPQNVRVHLLSYSHGDPANLAIRVSDVRQEQTDQTSELVFSMMITAEPGTSSPVPASNRDLPIELEINGARSEFLVSMQGNSLEIKDHRATLDRSQQRGSGRVRLPADGNLADNEFYFVFDQPPERRSVVVYEDPQVALPLQLAAGIAPSAKLKSSVQLLSIDQARSIPWEGTSLILWQGPLPNEALRLDLQQFLQRGGQILFFPPAPSSDGTTPGGMGPSSPELLGVRWLSWQSFQSGTSPVMVENWRSDADLLAATRSGAALPVGEIELKGLATLQGEVSTLATLSGGLPLVSRLPTDRGGVYFFAASPSPEHSNLARGGVVLYVAVQRALEAGVQSQATTRALEAGKAFASNLPSHRQDTGSSQGAPPSPPQLPATLSQAAVQWEPTLALHDAYSNEYPWRSGAYRDGDQLLSVNRSPSEDQSSMVDAQQLSGLFEGVRFDHVQGDAKDQGGFVREIWRMFLILMLVAMVVESLLCIPRRFKPAIRWAGQGAMG
jgi:hypothetical protein